MAAFAAAIVVGIAAVGKEFVVAADRIFVVAAAVAAERVFVDSWSWSAAEGVVAGECVVVVVVVVRNNEETS